MSVPTLLSRFALLVALSASCRVRSSRSPSPPFGVSPTPRTTAAAAPDDVPPTRQRHGPRPTAHATTSHRQRRDHATTTSHRQRRCHAATTSHRQRRSSHDAAPTTLQGRQSQAHGAPHTPAPSPAHPATQLRTRPPTQPSAVTHDRRSSPARGTTAATLPATQHHTTSHGRPSRASGRHIATPLRTNAATRGAEQSTIAPHHTVTASRYHAISQQRGHGIPPVNTPTSNTPTNSTSDTANKRPGVYRVAAGGA